MAEGSEATSGEGRDPGPRPVVVFIVAGVRLYREGLEQILTNHGAIEVVGTAGHPEDAIPRIGDLAPDIALVDLQLPAGRAAIRRLLDAAPGVKVVAMAIAEEDDEVVAWAEAGISGYVSRGGSIADLVDTIRGVAAGELRCSPHIAATLLQRVTDLAAGAASPAPYRDLTFREREILDLIEQGLANKEIARHLSIALPTVKNHVHNILRKLQVSRRTDALSVLGRHYRVAASRT